MIDGSLPWYAKVLAEKRKLQERDLFGESEYTIQRDPDEWLKSYMSSNFPATAAMPSPKQEQVFIDATQRMNNVSDHSKKLISGIEDMPAVATRVDSTK